MLFKAVVCEKVRWVTEVEADSAEEAREIAMRKPIRDFEHDGWASSELEFVEIEQLVKSNIE